MSLLLLALSCTPSEDTAAAPADDTADSAKPDDTNNSDDTATEPLTQRFTYDRSATAGNPLQGFMTSYAWGEPITDFPASLEFAYVPLSDLMDGPESFLFESGLEPLLDAAGDRGHQLVLRPYIDYPGQPSGLPDYLSGAVAQQSYDDHGGGLSPDYEDADLRAAMTAFIAALGAAYDGDPRIAFVQVGLLGFWGEWHTWPHEDWFPGEHVQDEILGAYTAAFQTTHLQVRYPVASSPGLRVGFHDDSFAYSTVGETDWFFANLLDAAGADARWQEVPIGGELRPELQDTIFEDGYQTDTYAQDFADCVEATRASYLLNYGAFGREYESESERERAEAGALSLGYEFALSQVTVNGGLAAVSIENTGIAPFYYPLELALETGDGEHRAALSLQPGESAAVEFAVSGAPDAASPWRVSLDSTHLLDGQTIRLANAQAEGAAIIAR